MKTTSWLLCHKSPRPSRLCKLALVPRVVPRRRVCAAHGLPLRQSTARCSPSRHRRHHFFSAFGAVSAVRGRPVRIAVLPSYKPRTCRPAQAAGREEARPPPPRPKAMPVHTHTQRERERERERERDAGAHLFWHAVDSPHRTLQHREAAERVEDRHERAGANERPLVRLPRVAERAALPVQLDATRGQARIRGGSTCRWWRRKR